MSETEMIFRSTVEEIRRSAKLWLKKKKSAIQLTEDGGFESSWNPEVGRHLQRSIGLQKN